MYTEDIITFILIFLNLFIDNDRAALEDLGALLKLNKTHHMGYHSKAVLLAKKGDFVNAIFSLNNAIASQPHDISLYRLRADIFEKVSC